MAPWWGVVSLVACGSSGPGAAGPDAAGPRPVAPAVAPDVREAPEAREDELLVPVGDHGGGVTVREFQAAAARTPPDGPTLSLEQRQAILDELVDQELLFQEAFARGLYRDPKVKRAMVQQLLKRQVMTEVKQEDLPDSALRAYYAEHVAEFQIPEKAQVRRIFLRIDGRRSEDDARKLAGDLRQQLSADPTKFKALAQEYSDDAYQRRGGDMGYVDRVPDSPHPPELLEKIFTIDVGRVSEPFVAGGGVNLVLVSARREGVERPFEQVKGSVIRRLKSLRFEAASEAYVDSLEAVTAVVRPADDRLLGVPVDSKTGEHGTSLLEPPDDEEAP